MLAIDDTRLYMNGNDNANFQIHGHGYLTFAEMERVAKWCPFHMSEYAHCMGNALGNFREYWDVFRAHPALSGGCVWDWYDQTVRVETDRIGPDGKRVSYWAYGADWDERPNDANFCVNGIIGPERKTSPKLVEAAHVQQDIEAVCSDAATGKATLVNRAAFTFADAYDGEWAFFEDGVKTDGGKLDVPHVAPQSSGELILPQPTVATKSIGGTDAVPSAECFYRVSFRLKADTPWAKKGWEVAHDQLPFGRFAGNVDRPMDCDSGRGARPARPRSRGTRDSTDSVAPAFKNNGGDIRVTAGPTKAVFSRQTGTLSLLEMNGKTILKDEQGICRGPRLTCRRAFTDNDNSVRKRFIESGLTQLRHHAHPAKVSRAADGSLEVKCRVDVTGSKSAAFAHDTCWRFFADGRVSVESVSTPRGDVPRLPRLGLSMVLDESLENMRYYGRGPWENYVDRCSASDIAYWESTVTDQYVEYARPQDNGYKTDVRWVAFLDKDGDGVLCKGSIPLCVQALHYSVDELDLQRHRGAGTWSDESKERFYAPMFPRKEIMLNLDILQLGLGNGSCGPGTLECYAFPNRREEWTITFVPVKDGDYNALRSAASRVGQTIPEKSAVRSRRASGMGFDGG